MTVPSVSEADPASDSSVTEPIPLPAADLMHSDKPKIDRRIPLVMIGGGVLLLLAAVLSYRHGIASNLFPAYLAGGDPTPIRRYSAPWIAGAAGLTILAGFLLTHGTARLVHYKL